MTTPGREHNADAGESIEIPRAGDTLRLQTRAMACQFAVFLDASRPELLDAASEVLESVHDLESLMTVYRQGSPLSVANEVAHLKAVPLDPVLFDVLHLACQMAVETEGCFDPTSGPLVALWREAREQGELPSEEAIEGARLRGSVSDVELSSEGRLLRYEQSGVQLNLGGIGKGFALDRLALGMTSAGVTDYLAHGGHSSLLARGGHDDHSGWPVGIRNPLFPTRRLATVMLEDKALSTSGSGVEGYRIAGRRFSDILDPRTGWPAEGMLSVTVLADTAAEADALSTAFFVGGVEFARACCDNRPGVSAMLVPPPRRGQTLEPIVCGVPDEVLFFEEDG